MLEKIKNHKDSESFKDSVHLPRILWTWKLYDPNEMSKWLAEQIQSDEFFVEFANKLMFKSFQSSGYETKTYHYLSVDFLNALFEKPKDIVARLMILRVQDKFNKIEKYKDLFGSLSHAMDVLNNPEKYKDKIKWPDDE